MSVVWTEKDDKKLEAIKYLEEEGRAGRLVSADARNVELQFDVLDPWKASIFLGDLLYNAELESITGIKVNLIGYPHKAAAEQIQNHVTAINQLLSELSQ